MRLAVTRSGAEIEAEVCEPLGPDAEILGSMRRGQVQIEGRWFSPSDLRLFSIVEATNEERVRLALGGYDLPNALPNSKIKDPS
jgi:hypothetical protein